MMEVSTELIKKAVYELCYKANICLNSDIYEKIYEGYNKKKFSTEKEKLKLILNNAKIAYENKMPLCQDTGQVIVFLEIGQNILLTGDFIEDAINCSVEKCYKDNFFRKSVVKNAVFERINTKTNIPCIIHTKYTKFEDIKINVMIKGAGSENKSQLRMILPTSSEDEIIKECKELILKAGINACPPMFIGICIGATAEKAVLTSKEVFFEKDFSEKEMELAEKIKQSVEKSAPKGYKNCFVLDIKLKTKQTHIACMPLAICINCHSDRFSSAIIKQNKIFYNHKIPEFKEFTEKQTEIKEIKANDIPALKELKDGDNILLSGEIYTARDMAHKKLIELLKNKKPLPFDLKNKIIFYSGPCPKSPDKIIGSIGPTTAERMDKYAVELYKKGVFATIGKGSRSKEVKNYIKNNEKKYFTMQGGIAALLAQKVKKSEIIAFDELGAEAVFKIEVDKIPLKVEIG